MSIEEDRPHANAWMSAGPKEVRGELVRLSWPIAVSTLSYAVMSLVDTLFVGRIGTSELAGVALGTTAFFTVVCFGMGLTKGAKVLVAQAVGRGDAEDAARFAVAGLWIAGGLAVVTTLAGLAIAEILPSISAGPSGLEARAYTRIRAVGSLPLLVYFALREARYGYGDSQGPMRAVLFGNALNIGLDALFLFGFGWGVPGAAWATAIAACGQAIWLWPSRDRAPFDLEAIRKAWRIGFPTALQFLLEVGSFALLAALLAGLGEQALGAHQIALQVVHFGFLPLVAIGEAASVMAGHAHGAGRTAQIHPVAREAAKLGYAYGVFFSIVVVLFARPMAAAFTPDASLQEAAATLLYLSIVFQLVDAANIVARGILRGVGDVTYPAVVAIGVAWLFTPPLTWLFGYAMELGATGGWMALIVECTFSAALMWRRMVRGPRPDLAAEPTRPSVA